MTASYLYTPPERLYRHLLVRHISINLGNINIYQRHNSMLSQDPSTVPHRYTKSYNIENLLLNVLVRPEWASQNM